MKQISGLLALGTGVAILQGAVASFLPQGWCPDFGLLLVIAIGLSLRSTGAGLCLAALLGYVTDLLSGSLLGLHASTRLIAFVAARLGSRHLSLLGLLPAATFAGLLTLANAVVATWLTGRFVGGPALDLGFVAAVAPQILVNAAFAPALVALTRKVIVLLSDEDSGRRLLKLETGGWPA